MNGKASLYTSVLSVGFLALAATGEAQEYTYESGYIRYVDGGVSLQRAQNPEPEQGGINVPVLPGDRMWTTANSFAEIQFVDGALVRLGGETKVDFMAFGAEPNLRLWNGSVVVKVDSESSRIRIDTPSGSVYTQTAGTYRVDVVDGVTTSVTTVSGLEAVAELASEQSSVLVGTGQRSFLEAGGQPQEPFVFDRSRSDGLDSWSHARDREQARRRSVPLAEVPTEVHRYVEDLTDYGTWRENEEHGAVWYPTSVGAGWAPYRDGRWGYTSYGYTWVSHEPWGWAPYHYGRWGCNHHGWYWVPGRHWAPAWVSFAVGPAWIGWSPLGYHGGSVFAYDHGFYGAGRYPHHKGRRRYRGGKAVPRHVYDHGAGWNFSRKEHFGRRGRARLRASDVRSTSARARMHQQGAVLDRTLTAHAVGGDNALAPRGPQANPFARRARVSGTRGRAVPRTGVRPPIVDRGVQSTLTALAPSRTSTPRRHARPRGEVSRTRAGTTGGRSRVGVTVPRSGSRVFKAPGTARATGARGRSLEGTGTARRRTPPTRSRVTQTRPTRTNRTDRTNPTGVRSRARTFGAGNQQAQQAQQSTRSSSRREAVTRSPSRSRQRTTTRSGSTPSRNRVRSSNVNRATPRSQRNVTGPSRAPSRSRSSVTRTAPRSQRSSSRVSGSRSGSRSSAGRARSGGRRGGARRRN